MFYNKLLENIILPVGDKLVGGSFISELRFRRKEQWLSADELFERQTHNLRSILQFSVEKIPFYKDIQFDSNADPRLELKKFPIMHKHVIRENIDALVSVRKETLLREASSGSSGVQGFVYLDKAAQYSHRAIQILWWEWAGFKLGDHILQTGMTTDRGFIKSAKDFLLNTKYIPAYKLDKAAILEVLMDLKKNPRKFMLGYASSLYVIARLAEEIGIDDIYFEGVISWGDKMFAHFRKLIEKQFHTQVYDTYSCTEGIRIASQCIDQKYHMMSTQNYIELLDENGNEVRDGEMGFVVGTLFDNYAMPLVRYYIGDIAIKEKESEKCICGRNLPQLKTIIGRDTDIVKTRSGKYMIVHAFTGIFEHIPEIKQFRIVQKDLDSLEIEYIKDKGLTDKTLDYVKTKIQSYLNENFPVNFIEVEVIPSTPSGKPQIIQSFLNQSQTVNT